MLERQNYRCLDCGFKINIRTSEGDHIYPHSAGGQTDTSNGQMLCKICHRKKSERQAGVYDNQKRNFWKKNFENSQQTSRSTRKNSPKTPRSRNNSRRDGEYADNLDKLLGFDPPKKQSKTTSYHSGGGLDDMLGLGSHGSSRGRRRKSSGLDDMLGF